MEPTNVPITAASAGEPPPQTKPFPSAAIAPPPTPPPPPEPSQSNLRAVTLPKLARISLPSVSNSQDRLEQQQQAHTFYAPTKRIHTGADVAHFLVSQAYRDLGIFLLQLNHALVPRTTAAPGSLATVTNTTFFPLPEDGEHNSPRYSAPVARLQELLAHLKSLVAAAPPDPGPRRFGNASFRTWHRFVNEAVTKDKLLEKYIDLSNIPPAGHEELQDYFLGSFGSAQRLDYGTGHELSFLAFLGGLWKIGVFATTDAEESELGGLNDGEGVERSLVLGVLEPYFRVVRTLILTYTLEPAGSHGVWGLDDHAFLPYIFGSAQLTRPLRASGDATIATRPVVYNEPTPQEGSAPRVPPPLAILKPDVVASQRTRNLYFAAIGFIHDVKRGAFWEHSPVLYDVSGIRDGWGKINKGMLKMYHAEVLAKFPVVQHFPFGSLFSWDVDPAAAAPATTVHLANQPMQKEGGSSASATTPTTNNPAAASIPPMPTTAAPWAQQATARLPGPGIPYSRVPAARAASARAPTRPPPPQFSGQGNGHNEGQAQAGGDTGGSGTAAAQVVNTRAPWAK
ncbi:phosphotyrosyl phosphatase activator [Niveomyces insectorum RCEF 264]|uniref:Serine/threonine-protein phosphatase 2A activator n=1 Tax=Niveomyces insectorum RCEF 264 TaxID=1081102 RepID=A0A167N7Z1_9HYPO|nr:phosphotyrosyl phosphatase activator [Niveomyces insectorum RCEF 264]